MSAKHLTDVAILIGTTPEGTCAYSAAIPLETYWDGDHPWDRVETVRALRLNKLRGFLFDSAGEMLQHFESEFSPEDGALRSAWAVHADGTRTVR